MKKFVLNSPNFDSTLMETIQQGGVSFLTTWFTNFTKGVYNIVCESNNKDHNEIILKTTSYLYLCSQLCSSATDEEHTPIPGTDFFTFLLEPLKVSNYGLEKLQEMFVKYTLHHLMHRQSVAVKEKLNYFQLGLQYSIFENYFIANSCVPVRKSSITACTCLLQSSRGFTENTGEIVALFDRLRDVNNKVYKRFKVAVLQQHEESYRLMTSINSTECKGVEVALHFLYICIDQLKRDDKSFSLMSKDTQYCLSLFGCSVLPLVYHVEYEEKNIALMDAVLCIEKASVRWANRRQKLAQFIESKKKSRDVLFRYANVKRHFYANSTILSHLLWFADAVAAELYSVHNPLSVSETRDSLENLFIFFTHIGQIDKFKGLDCTGVLHAASEILQSSECTVSPECKKRLVQMLVDNLPCIKIRCIRNKTDSKKIIHSVIQLYLHLEDIIVETDILHKEKYAVRQNILLLIRDMLDTQQLPSTLFLSFYIIKLKQMLQESSNFQQLLRIAAIDLNTWTECLFDVHRRIQCTKMLLELPGNMQKKLKYEDVLYRDVKLFKKYSNLLQDGLLFFRTCFEKLPSLLQAVLPRLVQTSELFFTKLVAVHKKCAEKVGNSQTTESCSGIVIDCFEIQVSLHDNIELLTDIMSVTLHTTDLSRCTGTNAGSQSDSLRVKSPLMTGRNTEQTDDVTRGVCSKAQNTGANSQAQSETAVSPFQYTSNNLVDTLRSLDSITPSLSCKASSNIQQFVLLYQDYLDNTEEEEELFLEDVPDEFCDPLLMLPLREPYLLPKSNVFVEKQHILSHLCLHKTDPFNRTPLMVKELVEFNETPDTKSKVKALMQKFQEWKTAHSLI